MDSSSRDDESKEDWHLLKNYTTIGRYSTREEAEKIQQELELNGIPTTIIKGQSGKQVTVWVED